MSHSGSEYSTADCNNNLTRSSSVVTLIHRYRIHCRQNNYLYPPSLRLTIAAFVIHILTKDSKVMTTDRVTHSASGNSDHTEVAKRDCELKPKQFVADICSSS